MAAPAQTTIIKIMGKLRRFRLGALRDLFRFFVFFEPMVSQKKTIFTCINNTLPVSILLEKQGIHIFHLTGRIEKTSQPTKLFVNLIYAKIHRFANRILSGNILKNMDPQNAI